MGAADGLEGSRASRATSPLVGSMYLWVCPPPPPGLIQSSFDGILPGPPPPAPHTRRPLPSPSHRAQQPRPPLHLIHRRGNGGAPPRGLTDAVKKHHRPHRVGNHQRHGKGGAEAGGRRGGGAAKDAAVGEAVPAQRLGPPRHVHAARQARRGPERDAHGASGVAGERRRVGRRRAGHKGRPPEAQVRAGHAADGGGPPAVVVPAAAGGGGAAGGNGGGCGAAQAAATAAAAAAAGCVVRDHDGEPNLHQWEPVGGGRAVEEGRQDGRRQNQRGGAGGGGGGGGGGSAASTDGGGCSGGGGRAARRRRREEEGSDGGGDARPPLRGSPRPYRRGEGGGERANRLDCGGRHGGEGP
ncbi:hypothetical protein I4F81_006897 [Pyropia yezoensis]|uniref:Uncharacterized protein n=1 Tax=Pyropia yezoensis TaxID=2788 RepID=A0ACC3C201_PYRYE|nr:hypothetical protein I4F81_006897 [Neopyropia yezoensis]